MECIQIRIKVRGEWKIVTLSPEERRKIEEALKEVLGKRQE